jgi:starch synthase
MKILHVAAELAPLVRVGGVADGVAGLSRALARMGHEVTVALPAPPGQGTRQTAIEGGVKALVVEIPGVPAHLGVYGLEGDGQRENGRRFCHFSRAVADLACKEEFDVVHAHDWPGAAALYLLREAGGARPRSVLTIHNLAFQGIFPRENVEDLGLGPAHFQPDALEFHGRLNLLKAGILAADVVTTVSPRYAREILEPAHGELLDGVLRQRPDGILGVVNGIDVAAWDPRVDTALAVPFGPDDVRAKVENKRAFLAEIGLDVEPARPLVASLGRIVEQKGSDLVASALPELVRAGASIVLAGAGDPMLERALQSAASRFPGRACFLGEADGTTIRKMFAGADVVMMPSRFEPCGVVQMEARRYGAVPVARRTGGLADTIVDEDERPGEGSGFLFDEASAEALVSAVKRALTTLSAPRGEPLVKRSMLASPGWERPASVYAHLYRRLARRR